MALQLILGLGNGNAWALEAWHWKPEAATWPFVSLQMALRLLLGQWQGLGNGNAWAREAWALEA